MQNEKAPAEPEANERPPVTAVETKTEAVAAPAEANRVPDIDPAKLDADAVRVVARLRQHGHEAYLVGGCVRDLLLDRSPKDFDIATSATPNQVRDLFRNSRLIGRRFRLAHVYFKGGKILEVSTFRANPTQEEPQPSEAAEGEVHADDAVDMAVPDLEGVVAVEKPRKAGAERPPVEALEDDATRRPRRAGRRPSPVAAAGRRTATSSSTRTTPSARRCRTRCAATSPSTRSSTTRWRAR